MMLIKSFFRRIIKDFRHKELLPLKLIFFVQASTLYVLYPYLTIHMRELGINVEETAIMSAVTPFVAIVMPPIAGMIADRIGNFKILLSLFSSFGGGAALLLLLVPVGRMTVQFPERVVMDVSCPGTESELIYTMSQNHPCETKLQPKITTRIESCGYICHVDIQNETDHQAMLQSRGYTVRHFDLAEGLNTSYAYTLTESELPPPLKAYSDDLREHRKMKNNEYFKTSVRQLSKSTYFFPTRQLYDYRCTRRVPTQSSVESVDNSTSLGAPKRNESFCEFGEISSEGKRVANVYPDIWTKLKSVESNYIDRLEKKRRFLVEEMAPVGSDVFDGVRCQNPDVATTRVSIDVPLVNWTVGNVTYKNLYIENCSKRCVLTALRSEMCSNKETVVEYNIQLTFWLYLGIRVFIGIIGGTAFAMFEGAVIAILREQKADYGLQRIYGSIGGMISSPLSGLFIDWASQGKVYTDFRPAFYLYAALKIASGVLMLSINLEFKSPASNVVSDVVSVLKNVEIVALLLACFMLGTAWGYIESFLFWLLQDLGGSRSLMGITITVGGIAGIPLLVLSGPIIEKIGHPNVLFIGFVFYAVRLLGYSLIYNPWLSLIFEALESVTAALSFTAAVTYAAKLSTTTTDTSIQGLLGGLYYGVGKGSGSLIGGYLMKAFGTRPTYQIFAAASLITGIVYFMFNYLYLKKRPQVEGNDIVKKKPKVKKSSNIEANGLDNMGMDLVERNEIKKLEADGNLERNPDKVEKDDFARNQDDLEAMKNAKNLDMIEKIEDIEASSVRRRRSIDSYRSRLKEPSADNKSGISDLPTEGNGDITHRRVSGIENPGFAKENGGSRNLTTGKCDVTVERQPDDKK
ncbi:major facilitator superfamily domain-containing protein 6-B [Venturia canescens]|uniref:major facilitator superfamily domain-containing protein 6-B n=1 Tax=Venturia canescens TaxID=32260 RepID=UPI001C9D6129|nr:major facilitator superfamily domain-containing protein 6-B [Venturia canescens]XP_043287432.1 major facilitator superfamily domain-containing protein 6-B [Venturia canescens]